MSCDEKTGIQALGRMVTPMKSGRYERQGHEYERHGTLCFIANFEVATGKIVAPTIGNTRKEKDFEKHIKRTVETSPLASWIFVVDNPIPINPKAWRGMLLKSAVFSKDWGKRVKLGF